MNKNIRRSLCAVAFLWASIISVGYGQFRESTKETIPMPNKDVSSSMPFHYSGRLTAEDSNRLAALRQSASNGNLSQVPAMISILHDPPHRAFAFAMLRSLSRLGAREALPTFDSYLAQSSKTHVQDKNLSNFAEASRARLVAESNTKNITDSRGQADTKVNIFFAALSLTADNINDQLQAYYNPPLDVNGMSTYSTGPRDTPVGVYAAGELADMVYHGSYKDFVASPQFAKIGFHGDYQSALKIRLAQFSASERLHIIIEELAHKTALRPEDDYEIQLGINEGLKASQAAAAKLKDMDTSRIAYHQVGHHAGFVALFRVIQGVGDQQQAPLVEHFTHDSDQWVAYYAQSAYDDIRNGTKRDRIVAY